MIPICSNRMSPFVAQIKDMTIKVLPVERSADCHEFHPMSNHTSYHRFQLWFGKSEPDLSKGLSPGAEVREVDQ